MKKQDIFKKLEQVNAEISDRKLDGLPVDDLLYRKEDLLKKFNKYVDKAVSSVYVDVKCNHGVLQACDKCHDSTEGL